MRDEPWGHVFLAQKCGFRTRASRWGGSCPLPPIRRERTLRMGTTANSDVDALLKAAHGVTRAIELKFAASIFKMCHPRRFRVIGFRRIVVLACMTRQIAPV